MLIKKNKLIIPKKKDFVNMEPGKWLCGQTTIIMSFSYILGTIIDDVRISLIVAIISELFISYISTTFTNWMFIITIVSIIIGAGRFGDIKEYHYTSQQNRKVIIPVIVIFSVFNTYTQYISDSTTITGHPKGLFISLTTTSMFLLLLYAVMLTGKIRVILLEMSAIGSLFIIVLGILSAYLFMIPTSMNTFSLFLVMQIAVSLISTCILTTTLFSNVQEVPFFHNSIKKFETIPIRYVSSSATNYFDNINNPTLSIKK